MAIKSEIVKGDITKKQDIAAAKNEGTKGNNLGR